MFKIKIEKEFDGTTASFEVDSKEAFMTALGQMWDIMAKQIAVEEPVWNEILSNSAFESKDEFLAWFKDAKRFGIAYPGFDYDEWIEHKINEIVRDETDFHDFDSLKDGVNDLQSALSDIVDIANNWV